MAGVHRSGGSSLETPDLSGVTSSQDLNGWRSVLADSEDSPFFYGKANPRHRPRGATVVLPGLAGAAAWGRPGSSSKATASEGGTRRDDDDYGDFQFEVPPEDEWGSPNEDDCAMKDRRDNCDAPMVGPYRSIDDLLSDEMRDEVLRRVTIKGANEDEEDLLIACWALLIDNVDVVDWISCLVLGWSKQSCLKRVITDRWIRDVQITIREGDSSICGRRGSSFSAALNHILICDTPGDNTWEHYRAMWRDDSNPDKRTCAVVDLAATILHELVHTCRSGEPGPGQCGASYRIENSFRWAMTQRYVGAGKYSCCGGVPGNWRWRASDDSSGSINALWNFDGLIYPRSTSYCG